MSKLDITMDEIISPDTTSVVLNGMEFKRDSQFDAVLKKVFGDVPTPAESRKQRMTELTQELLELHTNHGHKLSRTAGAYVLDKLCSLKEFIQESLE